MMLKKLFPTLMLLLLTCLVCTTPLGHAEEGISYIETKLEVPDGSRLIAMQGGLDGDILAVAVDDAGSYHLLRWKDKTDLPVTISTSLVDMDIVGIDVAPDGDIALLAIQETHGTSDDGVVSLTTVVLWLDAAGNETARIIIDDVPTSPKALSQRRFACVSWGNELVIYDAFGNALMRESIMGIESLVADDAALYGFAPGTMHQWSLNAYEKTSSIPVNPQHASAMSMSADGAIYFISDGIHRLDLESGAAYMVMGPMGTCLGNRDFALQGFAALPDNRFALHSANLNAAPTEAGLQENNFIAVYCENASTQARTPFVITSIRENLLLEKAASEFQMMHPELEVELRSLQNRQSAEDIPIEDLVRVMNTELLSGGGGDVLMLDLLPINSIISRNILLDISHIVDDVGLLPGVSQSIRDTDGNVYAIPAELGIFQLWGNKHALEDINTLNDIRYAPLEQGQTRLPLGTKLMYLYATCKKDFTDANGDIQFQSEEFIAFLDLLFSIYDEIDIELAGNSYEDRSAIDKTALINGTIAFYPEEATSFYWMEEYYDRYGEEESGVMIIPSMHGAGNAYRPRVLLGIPTSAQSPSISEEFIRLVLREDMRLQSPSYTGFSTVVKKLDDMFEQRIEMSNDENRNTMYSQDEDGVRIHVAPSEEYFRSWRAMFDEVSTPYYDDSTILMFIEEELSASYGRTFDAWAAAKNIEQRAFLYLNE